VNPTLSFSAILTASSTHYYDFKRDVNKIVAPHYTLGAQSLYKQYNNGFFRTVQEEIIAVHRIKSLQEKSAFQSVKGALGRPRSL
jgi:hypothetical protein